MGMRLALAAVLLAVSALALCAVSATYAALPGYAYEKDHTITGSTDGALSDYQVVFNVHRGNGTDAGPDVFLDGNSLSWPFDVRFTDNNSNQLSYWIESSDQHVARIWVKVASIPGSPGSATVKMYYGRRGESDAGNGTSTFLLFDDFNDGAVNGWIVNDASPVNSVSEASRIGYLRLSTTGARTDWGYGNFDVSAVRKDMPLSDGFEIVTRLDASPPNIEACQAGVGVMDSSDSKVGLKIFRAYWYNIGQSVDAQLVNGRALGNIATAATTNITLMLRKSGTWSSSMDPGAGPVPVFPGNALYVPDMQLVLYESTSSIEKSSMMADFDYVFVRRFTPAEPGYGRWGPERSLKWPFGLRDRDVFLIVAGTCIFLLIIILSITLIVLLHRALRKK
jgi:hypothetical protein